MGLLFLSSLHFSWGESLPFGTCPFVLLFPPLPTLSKLCQISPLTCRKANVHRAEGLSYPLVLSGEPTTSHQGSLAASTALHFLLKALTTAFPLIMVFKRWLWFFPFSFSFVKKDTDSACIITYL